MLSQQTRHPEKSQDDLESAALVQNREPDCEQERDIHLARRLALNQPGALEELIERHGDHLKRLIRSLLGGTTSLDDLMQEILLKSWESAASYRGQAPLRHWLTRIAIRRCRNHQRSYRRWAAHLKSLWQRRHESLPADATSTESKHGLMEQAMNQLTYTDRELLVLYYFEEQSVSQLADQLGVLESTLHVRLHRSRERLKVLLEKAGEKPS